MFMIEREKQRWMVIIQLPCAKILTRANWKVFTRSNHPANRLQDGKNVFLSVTQAARKKIILVLPIGVGPITLWAQLFERRLALTRG